MKNSIPNVAVFLATYNGEKFIDEQLAKIPGLDLSSLGNFNI